MKFTSALCAFASVVAAKEAKDAGIIDSAKSGAAFLAGAAEQLYDLAKPEQEVTAQSKHAASEMAQAIVAKSRECFKQHKPSEEQPFKVCTQDFCDQRCGFNNKECRKICGGHAAGLFVKLGGVARPVVSASTLLATAREAAGEEASAMNDLQEAQAHMRRLNARISTRLSKSGRPEDKEKLARLAQINGYADQVDKHLQTVAEFKQMA